MERNGAVWIKCIYRVTSNPTRSILVVFTISIHTNGQDLHLRLNFACSLYIATANLTFPPSHISNIYYCDDDTSLAQNLDKSKFQNLIWSLAI